MNKSPLTIPVLALALVACANESPRDAAPPPAVVDPAPPGQRVAPPPPEEFFEEECDIEQPPPPTDEPVADSEVGVASSEPVENIAPTPDQAFVEDCYPPDDFDDEAKLDPGRVQLTVSNQSFEEPTVRLTIKLDGEIVADDAFEVGTQHNWVTFDIDSLAPGEHTITVESDTGASLEETFALPDTEGVYLLLDYFTEGSGGFNFKELEGPFMSA